jgi:uncharacterized protein (TIGR03086 family)
MDEFTSAEDALAVVHEVVHAMGPDDLRRPTRCCEWDVAALADHLIDTISRLGAAAGIVLTGKNAGSIDERIQQVTQSILAGWRHVGLAGDVRFSGRTLPAHLALGILSLELVVHGWDFAVALHRTVDVADAHAAHILALTRQTLNAQSRAIAGFDPPVPVATDAGTLDQLIAFTGRDPRQMNPGGDCQSPG